MPVLDDVTDATAIAIEEAHPRFRFDRRLDGSLLPWGSQPVHATGRAGASSWFTYRHFMGRAHLTIYRDNHGALLPVEEAHLDRRPSDPTVEDLTADFALLVRELA